MSNLKNIINKVLETICVFIFAFITIVGTYPIVAPLALLFALLNFIVNRL